MGIPNFTPPDDPELQPYWQGLRAGDVTLPACAECGAWEWYPLGDRACHPGAHLEWRTAGRIGTVHTFTTVERDFLPGGGAPYTVGLVELDGVDGPRIVALLIGFDDGPAIGAPVQLAPVAVDHRVLPAFAPV